MTLPSKVSREVDEVATEVEHILRGVDPSPFSVPAFTVYQGKIFQYLADLKQEAAAVAKRDQADSISVKHVEVASEHLTLGGRNKVYKLAGVIGGLGIGTSVSTLVSMVLVATYPPAGIVICAASGMVGGFLLAVNIMKD